MTRLIHIATALTFALPLVAGAAVPDAALDTNAEVVSDAAYNATFQADQDASLQDTVVVTTGVEYDAAQSTTNVTSEVDQNVAQPTADVIAPEVAQDAAQSAAAVVTSGVEYDAAQSTTNVTPEVDQNVAQPTADVIAPEVAQDASQSAAAVVASGVDASQQAASIAPAGVEYDAAQATAPTSAPTATSEIDQNASQQTALTPIAAQQAAPVNVTVREIQTEAKIVELNKANHTAVVRPAVGRSIAVRISPKLGNFDQIHVGDNVVMRYEVATAVQITPASKSSIRELVTSFTKPHTVSAEESVNSAAIESERQTEILAFVDTINRKEHTITLRGATRSVVIDVPEGVNLGTLKIGDEVHAVIAEAVMVDIEKKPA